MSISEAVNSKNRVLQLPPGCASAEKQHIGCIMHRGRGAVTSWSSWKSFTVTLLWSSDRVPLGNTPSLVMTTRWRTLKSRAMADASEGASTEGSDTVTISMSSSWPATGTEGWQRLLRKHMWNLLRCHRTISFHRDEDRVIRGRGRVLREEGRLW